MPMPILRIELASRRDALRRTRVDGSTLSFFAPTPAELPVGAMVRLELRLSDSGSEYTLTGRVRFRRARTLNAEPGLSVTFEGEEKRRASEVLARWAGKDPRLGSASTVRRPAHIPCLVRLRDRRVSAEIRDLSSGGAFVAPSDPPGFPVGAEVVLQLQPLFGRWGGKRLAARVVWMGEKHGERGFGTRFVDEPGRVQQVLGHHLARLRD